MRGIKTGLFLFIVGAQFFSGIVAQENDRTIISEEEKITIENELGHKDDDVKITDEKQEAVLSGDKEEDAKEPGKKGESKEALLEESIEPKEVVEEEVLKAEEAEIPEEEEPKEEPQKELREPEAVVKEEAITIEEGKAEEKPVEPLEKEEEQKEKVVSEEPGIDTIDVDEPSGNWLIKRIWWEKAEEKYEKIKNSVDQILEARMAFFSQRTEMDRMLFDPFYRSIGFSQGELTEIIAYLMNEMNKEQEQEGSLRAEERDLVETLLSEKKALEQLQLDVQSISKIDSALDDSLTTLLSQINQARVYEKQAWQQLKAIAKELSDKRARELYYSMDTLWKNVQDVHNYIKNAYSAHFRQLVHSAQEHVNKIDAVLHELKEKGIGLKQQAQLLEELRQEREEEQEQKVPVKPEPIEEQGLFARLWSRIVNFFTSFWR